MGLRPYHEYLDGGIRDLRLAARGLRRTPAFTLVSIGSLALGLALTAATISVVNAYLIRSLPYRDADRLYHVRYAPPGPWEPRGMTALPWTTVTDVVEFPVASAGESFYLTEGGVTASLRALRVTHGFVEGLGVTVAAGRPLTAQDFAAGTEPVALLGHAAWRDRFGSDPGAIGRIIRLDAESRPGTAESFRIAGVLAPGFYFGRDSRTSVDLLVASPTPVRAYMVKLRAGIPPALAERRITEAARLAATSPIPNDWTGVQLESAHERWVGTVRPVLLGVLVAVGLVLVIVCANVAVLMLLRSLQRQKEVAVRLALGSSWSQLARMLVAETALLSGTGLAVGLALTALLLGTLAPLVETQLGRQAPSASGIAIDTTVLLILAAAGVLMTVVITLGPLASWGRGLTNALHQDGRVASPGRTMRRVRNGLIAFEIAGSLVLLIGCGLMVRSLVKMTATDLGFDASGLVRSRVALRARNYADPAEYRSFHDRFKDRISQVTGSPVAFSTWPPFVPAPDRLVEADAAATAHAGTMAVSAEYFATFGIPLREGRAFTRDESSAGAAVAIVSETLAIRLWPTGSTLGQRVRFVEETPAGRVTTGWRTIVGVARDVRQGYDDQDRSDLYTPGIPEGRFGTFYIRTGAATPQLRDALNGAAAEMDREAIIDPPRMVAGEDKALAGTRFLTTLLTVFAGSAAFLAMLGIYGVTAYTVQQRHKEVAVRVALGATERAVVSMFLREGAWLLGVGTLAGLAGGVAVSRVLRAQVFGVAGFDPLTYAVAATLLVGAGLGTVLLGARGAARGNPASALNAN
jgi:predicted permease